MSGHESFEELCALSVTGDLEPEEFHRLADHLYECSACRASYRDFHSLLERVGPALEPERSARRSRPIVGARRRFVARAGQEGVAIDKRVLTPSRSWRKLVPVTVMGMMILVLAGLAWQWTRPVPDRGEDSRNQIALLTTRIVELERQLSVQRVSAATPSAPAESVAVEREPRPDAELSRLRSDYEAAQAAKTRLEENVAALSAQLEQLRGDSDAARADAERLRRDLSNAQREASSAQMRLSETSKELVSLRSARSADEATIASQRVRLDVLAGTVSEQAAHIERERELLAAGKDIRDLMGARNLQIVDVEDVGTPGKRRSLAGRIFYTQAQSLIFYAYDLENKGNPSKVAFQAWGKKEGRSQAPRSLGVFYVDNSVQKRWVLKFEDPAVLAQIDQVFVTVEPSGGSERPTTNPLLSAAFLNEPANHP